MSWEDYYKRMQEQEPDREAILKENIRIWRESHNFTTDDISDLYKKNFKEYVKDDSKRILGVRSSNELNATGLFLMKKGISVDEILYIDYPLFSINFYSFEDSKVKNIKEKLFSNDIKYIFIANWPDGNSRTSFKDKNSENARVAIGEQYHRNPDIQFVIHCNTEQGLEIFASMIDGLAFRKKDKSSEYIF